MADEAEPPAKRQKLLWADPDLEGADAALLDELAALEAAVADSSSGLSSGDLWQVGGAG